MVTKKAKVFVSRQISKERRAGKPRAQAVAIAFSKARARGFKVPTAEMARRRMLMRRRR